MSQSRETSLTDHAMLVVWGQFAHCIGLVQAMQALPLSQKTVEHSPQGKVLEFLVAILGGLEYLKDISQSARPLDKDQAVARAWGQDAWADYSGVSRTLSQLREADVQQIATILEKVSQPFIDREVVLAQGGGTIELDGDLTPRPVSNNSQSYPEATYGHMSDGLQLGYQAAIVTMKSPTYGRIGLSASHHTGKTVSATQVKALVGAAEHRLGRRPLRRTDLLVQRIAQIGPVGQQLQEKVSAAQDNLTKGQGAEAAVAAQLAQAKQGLAELQATYEQQQRPERPYSYLAKARQQVAVYQRRLSRRQRQVAKASQWLIQQQARLQEWERQKVQLAERLQRFQAENQANASPLQAIFRLDAGFGSAENIAWLIEMGYEVYGKPYGNWLSGTLAHLSSNEEAWQKVGRNAEMMAWKAVPLDDFPYPLDLGYERFWTGNDYRFSGLLHFGCQDVTADLSAWFHRYNARQTIEAGNKESKQVFEVHHLKVRARPALRLQEHFALFAANFVRFATPWLAEQCPQLPTGWRRSTAPCVKEQVKVGAHAPALVEWVGQDCLLRFDDRSVYAGRSFHVRRQVAIQLALPFKIAVFLPI